MHGERISCRSKTSRRSMIQFIDIGHRHTAQLPKTTSSLSTEGQESTEKRNRMALL